MRATLTRSMQWHRSDATGNSLLAESPQISYIDRPMNKHQAIARLKRHAEAIRALGATSLYLFGSVARDEAKARSDLDLFIDYDPDGKFSLLELVGIKLLLEDKLGVQVDVTTRDSLHPMLRAYIEHSAVRVF
jgi:predicted nucleotidyltransferase